jgi:A/G-specific adenine glycosylase
MLPKDIDTLRKLPGIGKYTAGAIASLAFNLNEPVLDGNIRRVLARVYDIREPIRSTTIEKRMWKLVKSHLPEGKAGFYNQAFMDLGAIICTPRNPTCELCPLSELCQAFKLGVQEQRPVIRARLKIPHYTVTAAIIYKHDQVLITQRPEPGLLGGMWEFPGGKLQAGETLETCLKREIREELGIDVAVRNLFGIYHHAYTHFKVSLNAFCCEMIDSNQPRPIQVQDFRWVTIPDMNDFPMGKIDRSIAKKLGEGFVC